MNTNNTPRTFFTSDTHFGHANISKFCNRPWLNMPIEEMNEGLVARWNAVVAPTDVVWHFGDLAMGPIAESLSYAAQCVGTKILVPGNHDRCWSGDKRADRSRGMYEDAGFIIADEQVSFDLFDQVSGQTVQAIGCHFPYVGDSHDADRYSTMRPTDTGVALIHGHVHDKWTVMTAPETGSIMINVGVDAAGWDYAPVSESTVAAIIVGHHAARA